MTTKTIQKSLGDYILDRTESLDDSSINEYFVDHHNDKLARLLDSEQYLLEGSRGSGKTMLLKKAALIAQENFNTDSILAVWISFEESLRLENITINDKNIDPFLQWTMGKILKEIISALKRLKPEYVDSLNQSLAGIFGCSSKNDYQKYYLILEEYIDLLERGGVENTEELKAKYPSKELVNILENPTTFKNFLKQLMKDFNLNRIILLFDEAAHVFSVNQQATFFSLFKALRDPKIACKAAVYPGLTNYGKYFDRGQDAKEIRLDWSPTESSDIEYIKTILKIRIQKYSQDCWQKLTVSNDIIKLICICSNGNPRFAFHIIDELENQKVLNAKITYQDVLKALKNLISIKWKEFYTLKERLLKYAKFIEQAEATLKNHIIPDILSRNNSMRKNEITKKNLSAGFYVSMDLEKQLSQLFAVLNYANLITIDFNKKSLGQNKTGYYIQINPTLLFTELILKDVLELEQTTLSAKVNPNYYETNDYFKKIISQLTIQEEYKCSSSQCTFKTVSENFKFCPHCGSPIQKEEVQSLYKILRSHPIANLALSAFLIERSASKYCNIGELYDASINDIKTISKIKDVRSEKIKNAAIEYMAG